MQYAISSMQYSVCDIEILKVCEYLSMSSNLFSKKGEGMSKTFIYYLFLKFLDSYLTLFGPFWCELLPIKENSQ